MAALLRLRPATSPQALARRDALLGLLLIAPTVLILSAVIAYPLATTAYLSLHNVYTPTLATEWAGLSNYRAILSGGTFWHALATTLVWTIGTLALQLLFGVAMALLLNRNIRLRALARSLVLFPYFLATVVAVLVWRWLLNGLFGVVDHALIALGLIDTPVDWLGTMPNAMATTIVIGAWKFFPFVVIAVLARLQTVPAHLYEAARLDGAGSWARFTDITLPHLSGVLGLVALLRMIWDFREFDLIYLLTGGGPLDHTRTLPLVVYQQAFGLNQMGMAAAYAVLMMLLVLAMTIPYLARARGRR
ncbi:carbohydrate ABC transporter permease [Sphingomonas flavalba]|uniref:carbohydrate ABC transporter permease n=1 Tax=Sphingomonas flavalba TaxID=2559804 RepID=UPI00109E19B6|nr:sugar ABC transporter permease [Sphingomonas flavalba]